MSGRDRNPQIFIAKLAQNLREKDLEYEFRRFGKIKNLQMKRGYAFIEYSDYRDAEDAIHEMDGKRLNGQKIVVQQARGKRREPRDSDRRRDGSRSPYNRERRVRRPGPQEEDVCYNCGKQGHWANECREPKKQRGTYFKDEKRSLSKSRSRSRSASNRNSKSRSRSGNSEPRSNRSGSGSPSKDKKEEQEDKKEESVPKEGEENENKPEANGAPAEEEQKEQPVQDQPQPENKQEEHQEEKQQ